MYGYDGQEYVVMNLARSQEGYISYKAIEDFKDGLCISTKYAGKSIIKIKSNAKIIVMANWLPDQSKLSADRWDIIEYKQLHMFNMTNVDPRSQDPLVTESSVGDLYEDHQEEPTDSDDDDYQSDTSIIRRNPFSLRVRRVPRYRSRERSLEENDPCVSEIPVEEDDPRRS